MRWPPNKAWTSESKREGYRHFEVKQYGGKCQERWIELSPVLDKKMKLRVSWNELKTNTKTKFLIITHNKITMPSIDRVYGVTMAQKGISDIVSVDFEKIDFQEAI